MINYFRLFHLKLFYLKQLLFILNRSTQNYYMIILFWTIQIILFYLII